MFDKTGTLTHGHPTVTKAVTFVDKSVCSKTVFLAAVGAAESNSEHPLATAITEFARNVSQLLFCMIATLLYITIGTEL